MVRHTFKHGYVLFDPRSMTKYFFENMRFKASQKYAWLSNSDTPSCPLQAAADHELNTQRFQQTSAGSCIGWVSVNLFFLLTTLSAPQQQVTHGQRVGIACIKPKACL
jgi:hypothetical protein